LDVLKEERTAVTEDIKRAMEDKDFRENAPLEAAKERQGIIESRIRELENTLATAQLLSNKPKGATLRSTVGSKMTLKDHGSGRQIVYTLVDVREADAASGKISTSSPVGQALLDKAVGEEVTVKVPRGTQQYLIQRIQS
jgi:transcription elongation factor GreA